MIQKLRQKKCADETISCFTSQKQELTLRNEQSLKRGWIYGSSLWCQRELSIEKCLLFNEDYRLVVNAPFRRPQMASKKMSFKEAYDCSVTYRECINLSCSMVHHKARALWQLQSTFERVKPFSMLNKHTFQLNEINSESVHKKLHKHRSV